ncbi:MAG: methyltransferase domain-containing protein, partial [Acidobacteriota bacterium]
CRVKEHEKAGLRPKPPGARGLLALENLDAGKVGGQGWKIYPAGALTLTILERILPRLRCLACGSPVSRTEKTLECRGCGRGYPVISGIPVLFEADAEEQAWESYFSRLVSKAGNSEEANSYFSLRSFRLVQKGVFELVGEPENLSILDVGCGTGHLSGRLVRKNELVGVDISLQMLTLAGAKGILAVQASGKRLPFSESSFDLVLGINILQSVRDVEPLVKELARVARPNGSIVISTPNGRNAALWLFKLVERKKYRHLGVYTANELQGFFLSAGCAVTKVLFLHLLGGEISRQSPQRPPGFRNSRLATSLVVEARKL